MPRPLFTPGRDLVPIVQEVGWAPGPVWRGAENLAPTRIRSPDRPAHSQSLYQLSYRGPLDIQYLPKNSCIILWEVTQISKLVPLNTKIYLILIHTDLSECN